MRTFVSSCLLLAACYNSKYEVKKHSIENQNSFRYPAAPNPDHIYYCPYPESNIPGSGWQSISERTEGAAWVIYAKAIEKKVTKTRLYGQEYDVLWSLECQPLKQPRGAVLPQEFWMTGLGRFGPNYVPCGPRSVVTGFNYVFYGANYSAETNHMALAELNNQEGLFRVETDYEARRELAPWLGECMANFCHEDSDQPENWEPLSLKERVEDAEYRIVDYFLPKIFHYILFTLY